MEKIRREQIDTDLLELGERKLHRPQRAAASRQGMIATAHYRATEAGAAMMAAGGNAIDAAVAAAFALGVCEPAASGLGGQTMMLVHLAEPRRTFALDGSSRAPNRATPDSLSKSERRRGYKATTVPSTPAVLHYASKTYGKLSLNQVLEPAIQLAEEGIEVSVLQYLLTRRELKYLRQGAAAPFFLRDSVRPYLAGTSFRQPVLASTLRRLAAQGIEDFYHGEIAEKIHADMAANNGLLHRDDLAQVPQPIERKPVAGRFEGCRVFTFPPPGAGRTLIEMLNVYQQLKPGRRDPDTPQGAVVLAETIRRAFLDRQDRPFDPNFFPQVTRERMLKEDYARLVARQIERRIRTAGETTHLSVMDCAGNIVALTQSIERVFGSCVATPGLGFLYNNYMSAFEFDDMSHPYHMRPNAAPWASVAPTIVFRGRKPWLALGSPGSDRITSSIFQVLLRLQWMSPLAAVDAPRLHCSLRGKVSLEATRMRDDIPVALRRHGYEIDRRDPYSFFLGCVQLVAREGAEFIGVADPRRDGSAAGPSP
jgi:gamma-glutamyltranspeptidase/glutathione hydrolase